jgi:hypothetical protein
MQKHGVYAWRTANGSARYIQLTKVVGSHKGRAREPIREQSAHPIKPFMQFMDEDDAFTPEVFATESGRSTVIAA